MFLHKFAALFRRKRINPLEAKWNAARTAHEALKREWDAAQRAAGLPTIELREAYKDASGAVWYVYARIQDLPRERHENLMRSMLNLRAGFTADQMPDLLARLRTKLEAGDVESALQAVADAQQRAEMIPPARVLVEIALPFFCRFDESPYTHAEGAVLAKLEAMQVDNNLRTFFLSYAWEINQASLRECWERYKIYSLEDFLRNSNNQAKKRAATTKT